MDIAVAGAEARAFASELLVALGARGVQETGSGLRTHFPPPDEVEAFVASLETDLADYLGPSADALRWRWQVHEEWEVLWRQGLGPRRVGKTIVIRPSWTDYEPRRGDVVLVVDPGIAFGTAEHSTTRVALELLEHSLQPGQCVADVGTGTGILAMAAARLGAKRVAGFDTDPYACSAARENAVLNDVAARVEVHEGSLPPTGPAFDGVVANIEWVRLAPLVPTLLGRCAPGGWLVLSGILVEQKDNALRTLHGLGLRAVKERVDGEWWGVALCRR